MNKIKNKHIADEKFGFVDAVRACQILGVSKSWLYKSTARCSIPHFKIGNKLMFKIDELLKYIEDNRIDVVRQPGSYRL
jgi:excisionase family DNA binding protein